MGERSALRWFVAIVFLLFLICALTMCVFFAASSRYEVEFLPALMLLAVIGIFGLEQALAGTPVWRRIARVIWCLLLAYSVAFNISAGVEAHAYANYTVGNSFFHGGRMDEAVQRYQKALALEPECAIYQVGLAIAYDQTGREDESYALFQKALEIEPHSAEVHYDFGVQLLRAGRGDEALVHFQKALEIEPGFPQYDRVESVNNIAWSLATSPEEGKRNGTLAVIFAENACQRTHYQRTIMVGTLAAAYAEAGRFDDAIGTAKLACQLASTKGETNLLKSNQALLALYQKHQAYRDRQANGGN